MANTIDFIGSVYDELRRQLNLGAAGSDFMLMAWPGYAIGPSDFKPADAPSGPYNPDVAKEAVSQLANIAPAFNTARFENSGFQIDDLYQLILGSAIPAGATRDTVATDPTYQLFSDAKFEFEQARRGLLGDPNTFYYPCTATPNRWYDESVSQGWTQITLKQTDIKPASSASPFVKVGAAKLAESEVWRLEPTAAQAPKVMAESIRVAALQASATKAAVNKAAVSNAAISNAAVSNAVVMKAAAPAMAAAPVRASTAAAKAKLDNVKLDAVRLDAAKVDAARLDTAKRVANALFQRSAEPTPAAMDLQKADLNKADLGILDLKQRVLVKSAIDRVLPTRPPSPTSDGFEISFQFCRVNIDRPWLKLALLNTKNWWMFSTPAGQYSTGRAETNPGMFPLLPTSFIAIRDLRISANWSQEDKQNMSQAASFGFFDLRGANVASNSIEMRGLQIIGWVCALTPMLPPLPPQ